MFRLFSLLYVEIVFLCFWFSRYRFHIQFGFKDGLDFNNCKFPSLAKIYMTTKHWIGTVFIGHCWLFVIRILDLLDGLNLDWIRFFNSGYGF
jgi:hypothetical protein